MGEKTNLTVKVESFIDPERLIPATCELLNGVGKLLKKYDPTPEDIDEMLDIVNKHLNTLKEAVKTREVK